LRRGGITRPIIVFTPILRTEIDAMRRADLTPALGDPAVMESWARTGRDWHLQIDTGMSRAGLRWDHMSWYAEILARTQPAGVFTHFTRPIWTMAVVEQQEQRFDEGAGRVARTARARTRRERAGGGIARTVTLVALPARDLSVRGRIATFGTAGSRARRGAPRTHRRDPHGLRGRHGELRRHLARAGCATIATVPVGYADGYRRALGNRGVALLGGRRVQVAGRVTMDMTMLDVTDTDAALGDVVTLLGRDGDDVITVAELAELGELSPYELLTGLRTRLPRVHREAEEAEAAA
jgi:alanine racemase